MDEIVNFSFLIISIYGFHVYFCQLPVNCKPFYFKPGARRKLIFIDGVSKG